MPDEDDTTQKHSALTLGRLMIGVALVAPFFALLLPGVRGEDRSWGPGLLGALTLLAVMELPLVYWAFVLPAWDAAREDDPLTCRRGTRSPLEALGMEWDNRPEAISDLQTQIDSSF